MEAHEAASTSPGRLHRRADLGRRLDPEPGARVDGHAQATGLLLRRDAERRPRPGDVIAIAGRRAVDRIEQQRRVTHAARERELVREAADSLTHYGPERHAPPGRLEADEPTPGRGDAYGATPVVGMRDRHRARRDERR